MQVRWIMENSSQCKGGRNNYWSNSAFVCSLFPIIININININNNNNNNNNIIIIIIIIIINIIIIIKM